MSAFRTLYDLHTACIVVAAFIISDISLSAVSLSALALFLASVIVLYSLCKVNIDVKTKTPDKHALEFHIHFVSEYINRSAESNCSILC